MNDVRLSPPALLLLVAVVGAGAFAAGRSMPSSSSPTNSSSPPLAAQPAEMGESDEPLPPGHPPTTGPGAAAALPAGHPPVEPADPGGPVATDVTSDTAASSLAWKAPSRWRVAPNASTMRLATYVVPRAPGDSADADVSITQAGGSVDANAERWIGQFDAAAQKTAKRTSRKVGALDVAIVEVQGTYSGGMGSNDGAGARWALLGAIVSTPGMPHFFKMTGPASTVAAARGEFDAMIGSLTPRSVAK